VPSDWMMGRIQRCSFQAQAEFIRLCCIYWNNEGNYLLSEAKIECECLQEMLDKNIIKHNDMHIYIDFLDSQLSDIEDIRKQRSKAGKKGASAKQVLNKSQASAKQVLSKTKHSIGENSIVEDSIEKEIPTYEEFLIHALSKKPNVSKDHVRSKYDSWVENDWKDGNDKKIKNWKSKLTTRFHIYQKQKKKMVLLIKKGKKESG